MSITKRFYDNSAAGTLVHIFTLKNSKGTTVKITNFGGIVTSLMVPDKNGNFEDIVLGYDKLSDYEKKGPYFGAVIGRYANRIGNACFELNGAEYRLDKNEGENHLHGGFIGFDKVVWNAEIVTRNGAEALELVYRSKDGEGGFPGNLDVKVTYSLTEDNALVIDYYAVSDKDTVVNLTNHSYFNLAGHASGNILSQKLMINADKFTPVDKASIPTGELVDVKGTPMDFTKMKTIGQDINADFEQIIFTKGYDHNWVLNTNGNLKEKAAEVIDEKSGRVMEVYTTKPGVQLYTANFLDGSEIGKGGVPYYKNAALCLETQYFPDSVNKKNFPSAVLKAGEKYNHTTIYKFAVLK
ncbi:galactose mutarotase [Clostridium sp. SYSU_GA19001]|uniref:aldose epimerase family protein n=1 Tax=Clostridium caldaquaticum TaxID=2940653 RepID=UPI002076D749|nr:aldose epimerase family protein [Clostridium caldaquaticum]MCM8709695.1 galactose mutarotase [Clostridium caldaquaticum]